MEIDLQKCADWLKAHDDYVILTHAHPDGDTLGSGFALCTALRRLGKHANVLNESTLPAKYSYIYDSYTPQTFEVQHVVAVDIATESLLGGLQPQYAGKVDLCVDHHGSNTFYAMQSYVDPGSASCAGRHLYCRLHLHRRFDRYGVLPLRQHHIELLFRGGGADQKRRPQCYDQPQNV